MIVSDSRSHHATATQRTNCDPRAAMLPTPTSSPYIPRSVGPFALL
jgi:hypothetical protein